MKIKIKKIIAEKKINKGEKHKIRFFHSALTLWLILGIFITCKATSPKEETTDFDFILGVLNTIETIEETSDTVSDFIVLYDPYIGSNRNKMPLDILGIVKAFSVPENDYHENLENVLGFLERAYSEHDYHESGSWIKESRGFNKYVPYQGELPVYTNKDFVSPITGRLTSGFGYRSNRHKCHYGIDIALNTGDSVKCVLPGVVERIGYEPGGYGHFVVMVHSGEIETIYAHLCNTFAIPGQQLSAGSVVGLGGATGNSTGPHLHFETRFKGVPVNPFTWFKPYFNN